MKTTTLKQLSLVNFKGLKNEVINFENRTDIYARNGLGKTTILDAFLWLLFNKNSKGQTAFGVKTYDHNGDIIPRLSHEVSAIMVTDGQEVTLRKTLTEKWVKPHGKTEEEFQGNETTYEVNNVPYKAKDYAAYISDILPEDSFRAVTNPLYFTSLEWTKQKQLLITLVGGVSQDEVINGDQAFANLLANLNGKDMELYRKEIVATKNKCKKEAETIEPRIDENNRSMPAAPDTEAQQKEIDIIKAKMSANTIAIADSEKELTTIDNSLADASSRLNIIAGKRERLIDRKTKLLQQQTELTATISSEVSAEYQKQMSLRNMVLASNQDYQKSINSLEYQLSNFRSQLDHQEELRKVYRNQIDDINAEKPTFSDICPTCGQPLPQEQIADAIQRHNNSKAERIKCITTTKGIPAKEESERLAQQILETENKIKELQTLVKPVPAEPVRPEIRYDEDIRYINIKEQIDAVDVELKAETTADDDISELLRCKAKLMNLINDHRHDNDELASRLTSIEATNNSYNEQKQRLEERNNELRKQLQDLYQHIADLEQQEDLITAYKAREVSILETKVNNKFQICRWRFYKPLVNGGQEETCECTINGVPFADANRAAQINAGIDIINALQTYYNFSAPIFVDNAEAINRLHPTMAQVITLNVSEDNGLTIKYNQIYG